MKLLVLSDSHCSYQLMRIAVSAVHPDMIIHLGDHFDDGEVIAQENPHVRVIQVPGNCDRFRMPEPKPEIMCFSIFGVKTYISHGHLHGVKSNPYRLISDARRFDARLCLYGHTHEASCFFEDGIWVMNPGTCGSTGGSVGLVEIKNEEITSVRVLRLDDLEEFK